MKQGSLRNGDGKADMTEPDFSPTPGEAIQVAPHVLRIVAPNPSPMTYRGTNTYIVGADSVAVIDPGPIDPSHQVAILDAVGRRRVSHICVTHSHLDHSPLARGLSDVTGAPVMGFGASDSGRSAVMQKLADEGLAGGGEGVDPDFAPDICVPDGAVIEGEGWRLKVLHTPGHMGNHIALVFDDVIFTGDLVMGWASSLVSPPDGDLDDFMASCRLIQHQKARILLPGHGATITDPVARIDWLIVHRRGRTEQILEALQSGPQTALSLAQLIYRDVPSGLLSAAVRNVFAHLVSLHSCGQVTANPKLQSDAIFTLT